MSTILYYVLVGFLGLVILIEFIVAMLCIARALLREVASAIQLAELPEEEADGVFV